MSSFRNLSIGVTSELIQVLSEDALRFPLEISLGTHFFQKILISDKFSSQLTRDQHGKTPERMPG